MDIHIFRNKEEFGTINDVPKHLEEIVILGYISKYIEAAQNSILHYHISQYGYSENIGEWTYSAVENWEFADYTFKAEE